MQRRDAIEKIMESIENDFSSLEENNNIKTPIANLNQENQAIFLKHH